MKVSEKLKKYQPNSCNLFFNALKNNKFFHAYLLVGKKGSSLGTYAKYLAKSLLCENDVFACENCNTCLRVEEETYGDFLKFDARIDSLKIDDIKNKIEDLFSRSASEKRGIKVYIIENIEYLNSKMANALLKFIEEPPQDTYAIFTSENEGRILPTILSRLEIIRFKDIDKEIFVNKAKEEGIINEDFYLLSYLYNDYDEIILNLTNQTYLKTKEILIEFLKRISKKEESHFFIEKEIIPSLNTKEKIYIFYDLLIAFFNEALKNKLKEKIFLTPFLGLIEIINKNIPDLEYAIKLILEDENLISKNINSSLLLLNTLTNLY